MKTIIIMWLVSLTPQFEPLAEVEMLYYRGSYEEAIGKAESFLARDSTLESQAVVELRKYIAFSLVALQQRDEAKKEFRVILELDPTLDLDPRLVSPKIIEVFDEVKEEMGPGSPQPDSAASPGILNPQFASGALTLRVAALRSFAFPGLGQVYAGEKTRGWLFIAGEGLSLGGFIVSQVFTLKTHRDYLKATDPVEIEARYKVYNNWYRMRNVFGGLAIGIWISAPLDILVFPPSWAKGR